jgi:hypothetical protein
VSRLVVFGLQSAEDDNGILLFHLMSPDSVDVVGKLLMGSKPAQANFPRDPHPQNNQSKMDRRCDPGGGVPALQMQIPELKPQS